MVVMFIALISSDILVFLSWTTELLAANAGRKKVTKNRHLGTIPQLCQPISSQLRHVSTIGKKLVKQQYLLYMSP